MSLTSSGLSLKLISSYVRNHFMRTELMLSDSNRLCILLPFGSFPPVNLPQSPPPSATLILGSGSLLVTRPDELMYIRSFLSYTRYTPLPFFGALHFFE